MRAQTERLVLAEPDEVRARLRDALAGGLPFAPLPPGAAEREQAIAMLAPEEPVVEPDAAVVVATSGSTGRPKGAVLTRSAIAASVRATHERLGGPGSWVHALPAHYVAGLMVLARAELAGTLVETVPADLRGLGAAVERLAGAGGRRYLSLVPTQLQRALTGPTLTAPTPSDGDPAQLVEAPAGLDAVLLGGAPAAPALLATAAGRGVTVVTTYGMSETCGGCVYDGVPLDGVGVQIGCGTGADAERVVVGGSTVFAGYRLRPDLTAAVLADGRFRTGDRGRLTDGRLEVLGRVDDVVLSGGLNVDLAEVERVLTGYPGRGRELAVVGVPDPEWGTRVVAVSEQGVDDLAGLRCWVGDRLPAYAAPRQLRVLDALPRTSGGKIDRRELVHRLTSPPRPDRGSR